MKRYYAEAIATVAGGGALLGAANLFLPTILAIMVAFGLGVIAFARVFMAPGTLTVKRDVFMFVVIIGALWVARLMAVSVCDSWLTLNACSERDLRASSIVNALSAGASLMLLWSWARIRLLREQIANERSQ